MSRRLPDGWQWGLLLLVFAAVAAWNLWQVVRLRGVVEGERARADRVEAAARVQAAHLQDAWQRAAGQQGRRLTWPPLERLSAPGAAGGAEAAEPATSASETSGPEAVEPAAGHRLVMYFSERACSTCREIEAQFLAGIAAATGGAGVALVAHADNPRYVLNFVRDNGLGEIPVFYDGAGRFGPANGIDQTPMLFVLDAGDRVLLALYPLPDLPQWSQPFHDRAAALLGLT